MCRELGDYRIGELINEIASRGKSDAGEACIRLLEQMEMPPEVRTPLKLWLYTVIGERELRA